MPKRSKEELLEFAKTLDREQLEDRYVWEKQTRQRLLSERNSLKKELAKAKKALEILSNVNFPQC